ncbi:hypothetical protein RW64_19685 [Geobacter sulfurreducens]|nr:hypothetical protein RW64_19685 [Geobacter sulfurreducens]
MSTLIFDSKLLVLWIKFKKLVALFIFKIGYACGYLVTTKRNPDLICFFPCFHVGGAEKVHADILAIASDKKPWILIDKQSKNTAFKKLFDRSGKLIDISSYLKNMIFRTCLTGYFACLINRCEKIMLFGSNSFFYYDLLPYLNSSVYCVDLIHAFGGGAESYSLPHVSRINRRIVINYKCYQDLQKQYCVNNISSDLIKRVDIVENKVIVQNSKPLRACNSRLNVIYVGRGTPEKRVHLISQIARICHDKDLPVDFTLVGDLKTCIAKDNSQYCIMLGEIHDVGQLEGLYQSSDLILITSSREGFPLVIMEAMANGVVPVATDVGGISTHVRHGENGFLVENFDKEECIVDSFIEIIEKLVSDKDLLIKLSDTAWQYASAHFRGDKFDTYYRQLFNVA